LQHPHFFEILHKKAVPNNLTELDLRYCMLIFLNYSNSNIECLLSVSSNTVKSQKQRLKKKLNLAKGENLDDFLRSIESKEY